MDRTLANLRRIVLPDSSVPITSAHAFNLPLISVLLGIDQPTWKADVPAILSTSSEPEDRSGTSNDIEWLGENLNESQKEAIRFCLKANHVGCIHGPPGVSLHSFLCRAEFSGR